MTELIDKLRKGAQLEFDPYHSNVERTAYKAAENIINYNTPEDLYGVLALILTEHAQQEKCIEMQDYQLRGYTNRPWARSMDSVRKHL